jgi:hypothetical protein
MKLHRRIVAATTLALAMSIALPVLADGPLVVSKGKHSYVYYRDHEIYFQPESKTYYWQENGEWQSGSVLPQQSRSYVTSGGVTIELETERPYDQHDEVVSRYATIGPGGATTTEETVAKHADGSTTTTTTTTKHEYVYYRDHDIYFAPADRTYYWQKDGEWQSGPELPLASRAFVTRGGVTIQLDTDRPYTLHDYVVTNYKNKQ